jgi:hypothetical protein
MELHQTVESVSVLHAQEHGHHAHAVLVQVSYTSTRNTHYSINEPLHQNNLALPHPTSGNKTCIQVVRCLMLYSLITFIYLCARQLLRCCVRRVDLRVMGLHGVQLYPWPAHYLLRYTGQRSLSALRAGQS